MTACAAGEAGRDGAEVVDSAGIRIVTSRGPAAEWSLADDPILELGQLEGARETGFFRIRDILFLPDERIAIANQGSETIRFFTTTGAYLGEAGGEGAGPDEFRLLSWIALRGDSLLAYDELNDRVSVRDLEGRLARSFRLEWHSGRIRPAAVLADGDLLAYTVRGLGDIAGNGVVVDSALLSVHDLEGARLDTLARVPLLERVVKSDGYRNTVLGLPFSTFGSLIVAPGGVCHTFGPAPQLGCLAEDGAPATLIRTGLAPRPVTPEHAAWFWQDALATADENPPAAAALQRMRDDMPFPEAFPAFSDLLTDDAGRIWAQVYRLPESEDVEWHVFEDGRWAARLAVDPAFRVEAVSADRAIGVWTDELGVESVRMYLIER